MTGLLIGAAIAFPIGYVIGDTVARKVIGDELRKQARIERTRRAMAAMRNSRQEW